VKTYKTYSELIEGYQAGKIPVCIARCIAEVILQSMDHVSPDADPPSHDEILDLRDSIRNTDEDRFDFMFGGDINIVEYETDLYHMVVAGRNVTEAVAAWDVCGYLLGSAGSGWVEFFMATNNSGGPCYFVPKAFWKLAQVEAHISASQH
jgi:hypothetical protein